MFILLQDNANGSMISLVNSVIILLCINRADRLRIEDPSNNVNISPSGKSMNFDQTSSLFSKQDSFLLFCTSGSLPRVADPAQVDPDPSLEKKGSGLQFFFRCTSRYHLSGQKNPFLYFGQYNVRPISNRK